MTGGLSPAADMPDDASRDAFLEKTLQVWQSRTQRRLTKEDAREIAENMAGFISILQEWAAEERLGKGTDSGVAPGRHDGVVCAREVPNDPA